MDIFFCVDSTVSFMRMCVCVRDMKNHSKYIVLILKWSTFDLWNIKVNYIWNDKKKRTHKLTVNVQIV